MTIEEKIAVMQAAMQGAQIEYKRHTSDTWTYAATPVWNWNLFDYRVKPKNKYIPYETAEQFLQAQLKHGRFISEKYSSTRYAVGITMIPDVPTINFICSVKTNFGQILSADTLFEHFVFSHDGTPCGKEIIE